MRLDTCHFGIHVHSIEEARGNGVLRSIDLGVDDRAVKVQKQIGDNFNRVVNVYAWLDSQVDLLDANPDCASNYWFAEPIIGVVTPPTCIN